MEAYKQPRALIVDDDAIVRGAACESLREAGFIVSQAENGIQALQRLEKSRPEVILLDILMPGMDGFVTASTIRQLPGYEFVPILIMTALEDLDSIHRAYEVGATDFITKPINWVILLQRIRYIMRAVRMMNEQKQLEMQLQQAQKMEAVATLAGGVAHDFNNLLQIIQGASEWLLAKTNRNTTDFDTLNDILAAAVRGGELTRQLLTYSRDIKSERRPINLNDQVRQVSKLLHRTFPKMIEIEVRLEKDLKMVDADAVQMEQVLMNLAINARDAMTNGGKLSIRTSKIIGAEKQGIALPVSPAQEWVSLSVSDTGHGMSNDVREKVFDPFFSTKPPGKGTGLGLSMVHGIVKNHDGEITCQSIPGKGTCFQIYFPVTEFSEGQNPFQETKELRDGDETILLVDDDDAITHFCKEALVNAGYKVLTASNGEEAMDIYRQKSEKIALILLDLIMPGLGGVNCLYELLQFDLNAKVVIISGHTPDDHTMQVLEACTNGYLRKPYTGEQLLTTVRTAIDGT